MRSTIGISDIIAATLGAICGVGTLTVLSGLSESLHRLATETDLPIVFVAPAAAAAIWLKRRVIPARARTRRSVPLIGVFVMLCSIAGAALMALGVWGVSKRISQVLSGDWSAVLERFGGVFAVSVVLLVVATGLDRAVLTVRDSGSGE